MAALVAAATLSNRYITDRFLPDKAIDLMDEAASRIRMEVESKPEEIENLDRRIIQLKIEREALKKEQDAASKDRLGKLEEELANLEQQSSELTQRWQAEKDKISAEAKIKEQLDAARIELEQAQRNGDLAKAGELQYGRIPELEKQLADAQAAVKGAMLREEVTAEDIAGVVSRWTGVPVERMLEGEREKLLQMEKLIGARVIGQEDAVKAVSAAVRRSRAGLQDPNRPLGSFLFLGPTGVGKTELTKALAEFLFDDSSRDGPHRHVGVHGEARGRAADRRSSGLCRLRRRRRPDRSRSPPAVPGRPVRRGREGARRRVQRAAAGARRRAPDRWPGPHGRLLEHDHHPDLEPRLAISRLARRGRAGREGRAAGDGGRPRRTSGRSSSTGSTRSSCSTASARGTWARSSTSRSRGCRSCSRTARSSIELTDAARAWLGRVGYDPVYGARPLKRAIQKYLQDPLADKIIAGEIKDGQAVRVDEGDGGLVIVPADAALKKAAE